MDLTTKYMGMTLRNPLMVSSSPLTQEVDNVKRMEDAGAGAVVMFSLFEEQLQQGKAAMQYFSRFGSETFGESLAYFPKADEYGVSPDEYLDLLQRTAEAVDIPVMGSLNGVTDSGWVDYARKMEQAGARGIELNVYFIPADPNLTGRKVEDTYLDILQAVKSSVQIPVAMKLSPFFSSMANMALQLDDAGADALVLFNRFYEPDFDLKTLDVEPSLELSTPCEIRLPLLWTAILYGRVRCSLAATRGVHSGIEVIKYLMAGADAVMTTSALLRHGIPFLGTLLEETERWMAQNAYASVGQMKGSMSQRSVADPNAFERANYIRVLKSFRNPVTQT
jgi:dihydroorotate dehydrogenase (fumarate)